MVAQSVLNQLRKRAMSAVSAESPRGSADLTNSSASTKTTTEPRANGAADRADFGPNQWLVDELYQRYLADPGSVDQAWWSFFADYHPQPESGTSAAATATQAPALPAADGAGPGGNAAASPPAARNGAVAGAGVTDATTAAGAGTAAAAGTAPAAGTPAAGSTTAAAGTTGAAPADARPADARFRWASAG